MKIAPFPELVAYAEEEARAFYAALPPLSPQRTPRPVRRMTTTTEPGWETIGAATTEWEEQSEEWRNAIIAAHLALLTDLSRLASRDAVCRLVAARIGWDAFDVAKAIEVSASMLDGLRRVAGLPELPRWEPVPGPAEALAAIVAALWGAP